MKAGAKSPAAAVEPRYFTSPAAFRAWFAKHAGTTAELVVGFKKRHTGAPSITWPEAVDEALCVGWIDGVRHRIDDEHYKIRFTPRKPGSTWSAVNINRMAVLEADGRVQPAGRAAFEQRSEKKSRTYAYEQSQTAQLAPAELRLFKQQRAAWAWFEQQAPSYRHKVLWWVVSPKQAATRERRLAALIDSALLMRRL